MMVGLPCFRSLACNDFVGCILESLTKIGSLLDGISIGITIALREANGAILDQRFWSQAEPSQAQRRDQDADHNP
jgi:hypothetical protein